MTLQLMLDAVRRGRMAWLWVGACVLAAWGLVAVGFDARAGVVTSLVGVFILGPMTSLTMVVVRETRFLPITSRDVWVSAWVLSSTVAMTFVVALQAVAFGIGMAAGYPQPQALPSLAFVALSAFAYGGALLPLGPLIGYTSAAATERRPKWLWVALAILTFLAYFSGLIVPWAIWTVLPTSFAALTWWSTAALIVGMAAALGAVAWTPQRFGGWGRPHSTGARTPGVNRTQVNARPGNPLLDRITGPGRLLVPTLFWAFGLLVTCAIGLAWYFVTFESSQSLYESFAAAGLLPFSAAGYSTTVIMGTALIVPFFAIGSDLAWDGSTRHLRVLPLSAMDVTRLKLMTTLQLWGVVWIVLLGIHLIVLGMRPQTLRPELFIYLTGLSALFEGVSRRGKKPGRPFSPAAVPVFLMIAIIDVSVWRLGVDNMFWTYVITGALTLLIACVVTYRSLTRSASSAGIYQASVTGL